MIKKVKWGIIALLVGVVAFTFVPTSLSAKDLMVFQSNTSAASYSGAQSEFVSSYLAYENGLADSASSSYGGTPGELTIVLAMAHDNGEWKYKHNGITTDDQGNQTGGKTHNVAGYVYHAVGCSQPKALGFVNAQNKDSKQSGAYHAIIDAETGLVWQVAPWTAYLWHGDNSNNWTVGVETGEPPDSVVKRNSSGNTMLVMYDKVSYEKYVSTCYYAAVDLCAWLAQEYGFDPEGQDVTYDGGPQYNVVRHDDVPSGSHVDPTHLWEPFSCKDEAGNTVYTEPLFTIEQFRKDVKAAMQRGVKVTYIQAPYTTDSSGHRTYQNPS